MEIDAIKAPLVFQCRNCKTIIGDSFSWVCSMEELKTLTLSATAPLKVCAQLETSQQQFDLGSTFNSLECHCGVQIGRVYKTTARHLDAIRDLFTFNLDCISSYQLGTGLALAQEDFLNIPSALELKDAVTAIQQVVIAIEARLAKIEAQNPVVETDGDSATTGKGRKKRI